MPRSTLQKALDKMDRKIIARARALSLPAVVYMSRDNSAVRLIAIKGKFGLIRDETGLPRRVALLALVLPPLAKEGK